MICLMEVIKGVKELQVFLCLNTTFLEKSLGRSKRLAIKADKRF